jgi:hypothetical protein
VIFPNPGGMMMVQIAVLIEIALSIVFKRRLREQVLSGRVVFWKSKRLAFSADLS